MWCKGIQKSIKYPKVDENIDQLGIFVIKNTQCCAERKPNNECTSFDVYIIYEWSILYLFIHKRSDDFFEILTPLPLNFLLNKVYGVK